MAEEITIEIKFSIVRLILPRKGCSVETNSFAKRFTSTPEISAELKTFVGKKVTVSNVRRFPNELGPYKRVSRQMSPFSAGHRQEICESPMRIKVGPQKSQLNVNFEDD